MPTFRVTPSGDDALGVCSNRRMRQADGLNDVIERHGARKSNHGDVEVVTIRRVVLMQHRRNASECLHSWIRVRLYSAALILSRLQPRAPDSVYL